MEQLIRFYKICRKIARENEKFMDSKDAIAKATSLSINKIMMQTQIKMKVFDKKLKNYDIL